MIGHLLNVSSEYHGLEHQPSIKKSGFFFVVKTHIITKNSTKHAHKTTLHQTIYRTRQDVGYV